jgi:hypothetical protein
VEIAYPLLSSTEHAKLCGLSINRFSVLKRTSYYQQVHNQYIAGIFTDLDVNVKNQLSLTKKTLELSVPVAMQALLKQAMQTADLRIQNKACNDLLDRHGSFPKITRQNIEVQDRSGIAEDKDNKAVAEMVQALSKVKNSIPNSTTASIDTPPLTESTQ